MAKSFCLACMVMSLLLMAGCKQKYEDISSSDEAAEIIGSEYETLQSLEVRGITSDRNYKKRIDYYALTRKPGFGGPEVVVYDDLKFGVRVKVKSVLRCTNCLFSSPIIVSVKLSSETFHPDVPVYLYRLHLLNGGAGKIILDPDFFRKLGN